MTDEITVAFVTNNALNALPVQLLPSQLSDFLPYLLNQAAELASLEFQPYYKNTYGMLRTEWRVLFHLGRHGEMTAKQICAQAALHKTKVSRAVLALEKKRYLKRKTVESDRRFETLSLTTSGQSVFKDLSDQAALYDESIARQLGQDDVEILKKTLKRLIDEKSGR